MRPTLNEQGLTALILLIAESDPKAKDLMVRLTINLIAEGAGLKHGECESEHGARICVHVLDRSQKQACADLAIGYITAGREIWSIFFYAVETNEPGARY
ncbi:hypothetical protein SAMN05660653_02535 [Desulfonatronum thiosulfatophilum]|uniref:Uncharacterized protein n=1 Tax=Desulfonatronum thiosulfatophilum TaxID=617002 RepID=A0A1G6E1P0_9BACT|nr:hypothetical protein [Desulfonatronum thiosulfatophilum]SDB51367.1 hypothetical protein SAMN05660653_02535 [Desulfonatronum thiosulfatophilum]